MRIALTVLALASLVVASSSCGKPDPKPPGVATSPQLTDCYTYYTLSADKKILTWHHECPPNLKHRLWTGEREIHVSKWQPGEPLEGTETMVAKAKDIQIPRSPGNTSPIEEMAGFIKCAANWSLVQVNLTVIESSGKTRPYLRNGTYDLKYKREP